jgi:hypothetical protein
LETKKRPRREQKKKKKKKRKNFAAARRNIITTIWDRDNLSLYKSVPGIAQGGAPRDNSLVYTGTKYHAEYQDYNISKPITLNKTIIHTKETNKKQKNAGQSTDYNTTAKPKNILT